MTVAELIEELSNFNPNAEVVISGDAGNSFTLCDLVEQGFMISDDDVMDFVSDEDVEDDSELNIEGSTIAVCLYSE